MERYVTAADATRLWVQTFGDPAAPAILLIAGAGSAMDYWQDGFCARLAAGGRHVIRYDARDTGQSTTWPVGEPGYTAAELTTDALVVLDGLGVQRAHLVGISAGGSGAAALAARHPHRVITLAVGSTSPGGDDLPPPREGLFDAPEAETDWSDRNSAVARLVTDLRTFTGSLPFDDGHARTLAEQVVDRSSVLAAADNHWIVLGKDSDDPPTDLAAITAPTLVWHGTADPLFPLPHGEAMRDRIPDARLITLDGVGHEHPPPTTWDFVTAELLAHTSDR